MTCFTLDHDKGNNLVDCPALSRGLWIIDIEAVLSVLRKTHFGNQQFA